MKFFAFFGLFELFATFWTFWTFFGLFYAFGLFGFIKLKGVLKFFHEAKANRQAQNRRQKKKKKKSRNLNMTRREGTDLTLLSLENVIELLCILPGRQVKVLAKINNKQQNKQINTCVPYAARSCIHIHPIKIIPLGP